MRPIYDLKCKNIESLLNKKWFIFCKTNWFILLSLFWFILIISDDWSCYEKASSADIEGVLDDDRIQFSEDRQIETKVLAPSGGVVEKGSNSTQLAGISLRLDKNKKSSDLNVLVLYLFFIFLHLQYVFAKTEKIIIPIKFLITLIIHLVYIKFFF